MKLTWTRKPPTKGGHYWIRIIGQKDDVVKVGKLSCGWSMFRWGEWHKIIASDGIQWSGPLVPPKWR
jgi:hypothetical protein